MYIGIPSPTTIFVVLGVLVLYLALAALTYKKKWSSVCTLFKNKSDFQAHALAAAGSGAPYLEDLMPSLIDHPRINVLYDDRDLDTDQFTEESFYEIEEDEQNVLLLEAEKVVQEIQDVINNIASNPPNHVEVTSKISAIVCRYGLFMETEYFDAINSFIAETVKRDCDIDLNKEELIDLWQLHVA
jgi:hypothetical protein